MQIGSLKYELQHTHIYKELRKLKLWKRGWQRARESLTMTLAAALCEQAGVYSENPRNNVHLATRVGALRRWGRKDMQRSLEVVFSIQSTIIPW